MTTIKTQTIPNPISGILQEWLICGWCGGRDFMVNVTGRSERTDEGQQGQIIARCACGYSVGFLYFTRGDNLGVGLFTSCADSDLSMAGNQEKGGDVGPGHQGRRSA